MTDDWQLPELKQCEELLDDGDEYYFRQVNPKYWDGTQVSAYAFDTSSSDNGQLSGARSRDQTAEGAYRDRVERGGYTAGTWAVTVDEVVGEKSRVVDDTKCVAPEIDYPLGHCYMDQRMPDKPHRRKMRINLARKATQRRRLYPPPDES